MDEKPIIRDKQGRFTPGTRGGIGVKHKLTRFVDSITEEKALQLVEQIVRQALEGDTTLLSNFQKVFWAQKRGDFIKLKELAGNDPMKALLEATADGRITDIQAASLAKVVEVSKLATEVAEIKERLEELEL